MASSRKSNLAESVAVRLAPLLPPHSNILIGLSGGMDSVVLIHLLYTLAPRFQWQLSALHVHHGISVNADVWADFCRDLCASYNLPIHIEQVNIAPLRNELGIEAAARKLRHAAFSQQQCDFVALAHHADDQAETLLLQLLRGAGGRGAASMPVHKSEASHGVIRPLLGFVRADLQRYAEQYGLEWIEDESNADVSYSRNYLRHRVLPLLDERFPAYRHTLARAAQHFAESSELLDDLARLDGGFALESGVLEAVTLNSLSTPRAGNLLRYFLRLQGAPMPQTVQLEDMLRQLCGAREDAQMCVVYGGWQVQRFQGAVYAHPTLAEFDSNKVTGWDGKSSIDWLPLRQQLFVNEGYGEGVSAIKLSRGPLTLRLRNGGESLRPHPAAATRDLKKLFQENLIPPWRRERLPLLYCGDELVCVIGVAIHAQFQAKKDELGVLLSLK